jgi:hypothetical protein
MRARLIARGEAIATRGQRRAVARVADAVGAAMPGVDVTPGEDGVTLAAPGLARRMLREPSLRWIGSLLR